MAGMKYFDLEGFRTAEARSDSFPRLAMDDLLRPKHPAAIERDFPANGYAGTVEPPFHAMRPSMNEAPDDVRDGRRPGGAGVHVVEVHGFREHRCESS